ncbi:MAG TPA: type III pantothenate kinase [Pirellulales bacterium]|jgi:type III pantothenate kinase|nr:type III pantothenate kinase [Pirellulales bacterium]
MAAPLIAIDIGNSRIKLGLFDQAVEPDRVPLPSRVLDLPVDRWEGTQLAAWLPAAPDWPEWRVASVNRPAAARLLEWIERECRTPAGTPPAARLLTVADLPLTVQLEHPERVGIDRLAAAVAVNRLRSPNRPAIVVDTGSAVTVDLIAADGVFRGGAIFPGIDMSARALHEFTDLLPLVSLSDLAAPPAALGISTVTAIRSGLFWGVVGAVRELTGRLATGLEQPPELFLTGGAAAHLVRPLGLEARYEPHLVLSGIAMARP